MRPLSSIHRVRVSVAQQLHGAFAIALAACSSPRPPAPPAPVASCVVGAAQPVAGDTITLATMAAVDWSHVPVATNAAERLAFAQLYETLIDADCEGRARPGLAASWTLDPTKTRVTVSLRHDAMFWSGKPLTADDVLAAWRRTAAQSTSSARVARAVASGSTVIDDHTLVISLPDTGWMVLASPTLAVYEQQATARWPEGSGPYRITEQSTPGGFLLMPIASAPYLVSRLMRAVDPRDAIDAGSDVLVTDDPIAVGYAGARANLQVAPLPWTRTYVLALPVAQSRMTSAWQRPDVELAALRTSLARDAVHADARAAQPPYWWQGGLGCSATSDTLPLPRAANLQSNRVVYARDDRIARGLAERLVAIEPRSVAVGLAPNDLARALRDGAEIAYVIDLPRLSLSFCQDLLDLRSRAPWLRSSNDVDARLVPLVDTRESAIVTRNRVSATVDWSGTLHFAQREPRP